MARLAWLGNALLSVVAVLGSTSLAQSPDTFYPGIPNTEYSYPSPNATGIGWDVAFQRATRLVNQLTVEEKVGLCTGNGPPGSYVGCQGGTDPIPRVGFDGLCYADSDTGLGNSHILGTGFPPGVTVASTFNRDLMRARGFAIATELRSKGVHVVLGPVLALPRTVGGGTNFEGFGADPYLVGAAGYETVIGEQAAGAQAEAKQYIGYDGQNYNRTMYSSNFDEKTLHEVLLWPYAEAVRAGVACVMTSYNYVNNSHAAQNPYTINDVLKTHLGFQGYTQTDWYGLKAGVDAILAGMDQDMPGVVGGGGWGYFGANYTEAVRNGSVPESRLTDAAVRILTPYFMLGQDRNYPITNLNDNVRLPIANAQRQRHRTVAREIATAGVVLLKNTAGKKGLPLRKPTSISLFGPAAGPNPYGPNQYVIMEPNAVLPNEFERIMDPLMIGVYQGTLAGGGGSGSTFYSRLVDPLSAIQHRAARELTLVDWSLTQNMTHASFIAQRGTVCIPVVASYAGEWQDRNLTLVNDGDDLIRTVADNCDNTIPIVQSVGPVDMEAWVEHPNVTAIIWANLGGQELGPALVDILYGDVNPSGRLIYTIAKDVSDYTQPDVVIEPQPHPQINYTEGVLVDYRGFEANGIEPRFWFGHGLSYSEFQYSDLQVEVVPTLSEAIQQPINYVADAPGGDSRLYDVAVKVSLNVTNEGPYYGTEIVQLYLEMPEEAGNPVKVLRGFESLHLRDGDTLPVELKLTRKDISFWDVGGRTWKTPTGGEFTVKVGASSNDIRATAQFTL